MNMLLLANCFAKDKELATLTAAKHGRTLLQGYGGRSSPPCRQLSNAPRQFVSRALVLRPAQKVFARPEDFFLHLMLTDEDCRAFMRASPQSDQHKPLNTLRCNINSAESLMGEISC